jgi:hypothetical protein
MIKNQWTFQPLIVVDTFYHCSVVAILSKVENPTLPNRRGFQYKVWSVLLRKHPTVGTNNARERLGPACIVPLCRLPFRWFRKNLERVLTKTLLKLNFLQETPGRAVASLGEESKSSLTSDETACADSTFSHVSIDFFREITRVFSKGNHDTFPILVIMEPKYSRQFCGFGNFDRRGRQGRRRLNERRSG